MADNIKIPLNNMAAIFQVHPRTILRAVTDNVAAYWIHSYNPDVYVDSVAKAYGAPTVTLQRIINGKDQMFTPKDAWTHLSVNPRTFRFRRYTLAFKRGNVARYSRNAIVSEHLAKFDRTPV